MAYFSVNDLNISPDEFLQECSRDERDEAFDLLIDHYGYSEYDEDNDDPRSEGQRNFNKNLKALKESWFAMSKEDAEIINILAKKYGAY